MTPALAPPTRRTVVALLLWMMAVRRAPTPAPTIRFWVTEAIIVRKRAPATSWSPAPASWSPYKRMAIVPINVMTVRRSATGPDPISEVMVSVPPPTISWRSWFPFPLWFPFYLQPFPGGHNHFLEVMVFVSPLVSVLPATIPWRSQPFPGGHLFH